MEFLTCEGVLTKELQTKSTVLAKLDDSITEVDTNIKRYKQEIAEIQSKRRAANLFLNQAIKSKRQILTQRKKRERQFRRQLQHMKVYRPFHLHF